MTCEPEIAYHITRQGEIGGYFKFELELDDGETFWNFAENPVASVKMVITTIDGMYVIQAGKACNTVTDDGALSDTEVRYYYDDNDRAESGEFDMIAWIKTQDGAKIAFPSADPPFRLIVTPATNLPVPD